MLYPHDLPRWTYEESKKCVLSRQRQPNHLSAVYRQAVVLAVEVQAEPHVIEPHQPREGRVGVAHVIWRLDRAVAERIGRADEGAGFDARALSS